ncbi:MAG TPA: hypothetical protein VNI01_13475 [Elusimicrobiota bacterium]|nr:hypothetical protein [Elusimicrobiota bacterium]
MPRAEPTGPCLAEETHGSGTAPRPGVELEFGGDFSVDELAETLRRGFAACGTGLAGAAGELPDGPPARPPAAPLGSPGWRCLAPRAAPELEAPRGAWAVLVMRGDAYLPGALVTAQSLRWVRTRHALVCMVTADVSAGARADLGRLYDRVVEVPYLRGRGGELHTPRQTELYGDWIAVASTKWNCLGLTEWPRVVFVDADVLFLVNCDDLFDLPPPAACFASPWAQPWCAGGLPNPFLAGDGPLAHGARVKPAAVRRALAENGFVASASLVVLAPDAGRLERLRALLVAPVPSLRGSGADEVALARLFLGEEAEWAHIHPRFLTVPWKRHWVDVRALHFMGRKPWDSHPTEWPDLQDWWDAARPLLRLAPPLSCAGRLVPPAARALPAQSPGPAGPDRLGPPTAAGPDQSAPFSDRPTRPAPFSDRPALPAPFPDRPDLPAPSSNPRSRPAPFSDRPAWPDRFAPLSDRPGRLGSSRAPARGGRRDRPRGRRDRARFPRRDNELPERPAPGSRVGAARPRPATREGGHP